MCIRDRGGSDQEGGMASAVYGAKIMKDLGLIPEGYKIMVVGSVPVSYTHLDHKVGLFRVRRRCRVLLGREGGDDLNGFAEARLLGAYDVTGERTALIHAVFGSGLHLPQRNAEDLRMGLAVAGHAGNRLSLIHI